MHKWGCVFVPPNILGKLCVNNLALSEYSGAEMEESTFQVPDSTQEDLTHCVLLWKEVFKIVHLNADRRSNPLILMTKNVYCSWSARS